MVFYAVQTLLTIFFTLTILVSVFPNDYFLPLRFYIIFLPIDGISVNWLLNFAYQLIENMMATTHFLSYFSMSLILMHQACWIIDGAGLIVGRLSKLLECEAKDVDHKMIKQNLKDLVKSTMELMDWLNNVQQIMQFNFLTEISLLSAILCTCLFAFASNPLGSVFALVLTMFGLSQFLVYCLMGSSVQSRIEMLNASIYDIAWHKMTLSHQMDLKMVLIMTQNIKGFHGIFKIIDLATFQRVRKIYKFLEKFLD